MFCKQCGAENVNGAKFCTTCGAGLEQNEQYANGNYGYNPNNESYQGYGYNQPNQQAYYPQNDQLSKLQGEILTMGILGLAFGCSFVLSFLGIIFSSIAKKKAKEYIAMRGQLEGRAQVGFNLAKPGFIVGLILTILFGVYLFACIMIGIFAGMSSIGYY